MIKYIYPPRPMLFLREAIPTLNLSEYCVQLKLNDTRQIIIYTPEKGVELFTRHNTPHKAYRPKKDTIEQFMALPFDKTKQQIFDSLLMHSKNETVKDTWVLMDWLVKDGLYQLGTGFFKRDLQLDGLGTRQIEQGTGMRLAWEYSPNMWKSISYMGNMAGPLMDSYEKYWEKNQLVEGIVLKSLDRPLRIHSAQGGCDWAFKVRYKKEGVYTF